MSDRFERLFMSANANKKQFEKVVGGVKESLQDASENPTRIPESRENYHTGWLRGSLSYPWAIVFIAIPVLFDII